MRSAFSSTLYWSDSLQPLFKHVESGSEIREKIICFLRDKVHTCQDLDSQFNVSSNLNSIGTKFTVCWYLMLPELLILKFNHVNLSYAWGNFKILNHCTEGTDCTFTLLTCIQLIPRDFTWGGMEATSGIIGRIWGKSLISSSQWSPNWIKGKKNNCCCLEIIILEFFVNQFGDLPADWYFNFYVWYRCLV